MRALALTASLAVLMAIVSSHSVAQPKDSATQTGSKGGTMVLIKTSKGDIKVELDEAKAPITVANFLGYVDDGYYDGTIFHRVIPDFMIQGGGFAPDMSQKDTKAAIKNEAANGLKNDRGTLAMARTSVVDSATGQFFISLKDNDFLNHTGKNPREFGYAVFAKVVEGMGTVDAIAAVTTGNKNGHGDVPNEPVIIESIKRVE
jgi:cyclophilin family peptidyl-prolyl cis-trans isomerase